MRCLRSWRSHESSVLACFLTHEESSLFRIPGRVGSAEPCRPFELEVRGECHLDLKGLLGFDLQQNHSSRFIHGHAQSLPHPEGIPNIKNRGRLRTNRQCPRQALRRQGSISHVKREVKLTEDLQGVNPCLQATRLVPEQSRARSHYRQKLPCAYCSR